MIQNGPSFMDKFYTLIVKTDSMPCESEWMCVYPEIEIDSFYMQKDTMKY
jgi:hypothetical protein